MRAKIITKGLIWSALIIGILILFSGIKGVVELTIISQNYEATEGTFFDYEVYSKGGYNAVKRRHTNDTYRLFYTYQVNGQEYTVSTDMGTGIIPNYGSVKTIRYNPAYPEEAFVSGPNSHSFKILFGLFFTVNPLFFIWLLKPEKENTNTKKNKKKSQKKKQNQGKIPIDGIGTVTGFLLVFFSYGMLYFITGEWKPAGILNFYRTSFIIPMVIPILMIAAGEYVVIRSLFFNRARADCASKTEEANDKAGNRIGFIVVILLFLTVVIGGKLLHGDGNRFPEENIKQTDKNVIKKVDFTAVHTVLSERGFETANIATTYWSYDESKITNVVSGIKGDTAFEFYEYTDGETTDGVYNYILEDISKKTETEKCEKYETKLQGNGKLFMLTESGVDSIVMYQGNAVIYAHSPDGESEIQDILEKLGYSVPASLVPNGGRQ
ncbi:MAG: DUF3592 domain-containing protein [Lachnospiraceae bacterium]|nr:DUF3592 domain-containing protein [Lachnospiraceae bacterium]